MHGCNTHHGRHRGDRGPGRSFFAGRGPFGGRDGGDERGPMGGRGGFGGRGGRHGKRFAGEELRLMVLGLLAETAPQHG
ncbi:MAG: PadR family transcriptional regulator, partial [Novosphingobium sp.]